MDFATPLNIDHNVMRWSALVALFTVRPLVAFIVLPATANPMLTTTTRTLLAVAFAAYAATGAYLAGGRVPVAGDALALAALREAVVGFTLGFAAAKVFWVAQCAGALLDNVSGYNNVQLTNPSNPDQCTPLSDLLLQIAVTLFWGLGGMLLVFGALIETHRLWPITAKTPEWPAWPAWPVALAEAQMAELMRLVTSVAIPMLFLIALIDIVFGLVSRAAKNADTNTIATPLRSAAALLSLALYCSVFLQDIRGYLSLADLSRLLELWRRPS